MKPTSLGDDFKACYYARDPEMLARLIERAERLERKLQETEEDYKELDWRMSQLEK